jgi:Glycine zipper
MIRPTLLRLRDMRNVRPVSALQKTVRWVGRVAALAACVGCVSEPATRTVPVPPPPPPDTNVFFYPARGQSPQQQDRDKYECNTWAVQQSGFDPSAPNVPPHLRVAVSGGPPPGSGVAAGAVTGAVLGAVVAPPWQAGPGALIGALAGATIGGIAENAAAERTREQLAANVSSAQGAQLEQEARNYRRAMSACLEGRGYNVR